jgi:hypothetical protein
MDECDTAAVVFQCGQEQAPDLMANIISAVELNSSSVSFANIKTHTYLKNIRNQFHFLWPLQFVSRTLNA